MVAAERFPKIVLMSQKLGVVVPKLSGYEYAADIEVVTLVAEPSRPLLHGVGVCLVLSTASDVGDCQALDGYSSAKHIATDEDVIL